jgi:outer membrane lipoprotein-sorting protein
MDLAPGLAGGRRALVALLFVVLAWATASRAEPPAPLSTEQMIQLLRTLDERSRNYGDYRAVVFAELTRGKDFSVRELQLFRRDMDNKLMLLVVAPKTEAGKGYLSEGNNLWVYDPTLGRWERRTVREAIGGTDGRRGDFDQTRWATQYVPTYMGREKLGVFEAEVIHLKVKSGEDVAYPLMKLWVDRATSNVLKREEYSESGKLLRRVLLPRWRKVRNEARERDFWYPEQTLIYDELDRSNWTRFTIKAVDLRPLDTNVFTKAWLEGKSR